MLNHEEIQNILEKNMNEKRQLDYKAVQYLNKNGIYLKFTKEGIYWKNESW